MTRIVKLVYKTSINQYYENVIPGKNRRMLDDSAYVVTLPRLSYT